MKLKALGDLSGAIEVEKGAEFDIPKEAGEALIARGVAVEVATKPESSTADKPVKAKE
jgi:hypothetical protein